MIKDFEIKRLILIIRVGPKCNHKCPYKREAKGDLTIEEGNVRMEARGGKGDGKNFDELRNEESLQKLEKTRKWSLPFSM